MADSFSPYQIDYSVKNTSKTFGFSKKKVTFKFGVANGEALANGMTGANCRGSEHEVIFTWSLNTGKRQILADGKDVHYSETGQNGWTADQVFQHQFSIRVPGLAAPLRAHLITQPANRDVPQIKPFDLRINGLSYFNMCKIYELGTPRMVTRGVGKKGGRSSRGGGGDDDSHLSPEERKAIAAAKLASLRDLEAAKQRSSGPPAPAPVPEGDLINFLDDPTPPPPQQQQYPPQGYPGQQQPQYASNQSFGQLPPGGAPPPAAPYAQQPYSNYSLGSMGSLGGSFTGGPPPPPGPPQQQTSSYSSMPSSYEYQSQGSFSVPPPAAAPVPTPAPFGQPSQYDAMTPAYQQQQPSQQAYGYQQHQPPPMQQQPFGAPPPAPPQAQPSPSNQTYLSYGSAPTFAQPPQQPPQQPQYQQQQPQYQQYGAPPAPPQGFPQY